MSAQPATVRHDLLPEAQCLRWGARPAVGGGTGACLVSGVLKEGLRSDAPESGARDVGQSVAHRGSGAGVSPWGIPRPAGRRQYLDNRGNLSLE